MTLTRWLIVLILSIGVFLFSTVVSTHDALAVLYVLCILFIAEAGSARTIVAAGATYSALAVLSFLIKHYGESFNSAYIRLGISLIAIAVATFLSRRAQAGRSRLSEQSLWLALTHDTVIIRDNDDRIIDWNEGATRLYGWSRDEALGKKVQSLLKTSFPATSAPRLAPGALWSGEITRLDRDGRPMILTSTWMGRVGEYGGEGGVIELSADLTQERLAQAGRMESESRYKAIFNGAGVPIFELSTDSRGADAIVMAQNEAADRLVGPKEAYAADLTKILDDEGRRLFRDAIIRALAEGVRQELSCRVMPRESCQRDVAFTVSHGAQYGESHTILVTAVDMTERNQARMRVEQMQTDLAHASRISALGQMTAVVAHEINQPLMATVTFARSGRRWLRRDAPDLDEVGRCLDGIVSTGERAARVVQRIRAMSRRQTPEHEKLSLANVITETVEILSSEFQRYGVRVENHVTAPDLYFVGDRVQIHQVLVNVMLNAAQAMSTVSDRPRNLILSAAKDVSRMSLTLTVEDSGTGFPPELLEDGVAPFISSKEGGVGLGLSVSRTIMETHEGRLNVNNRPEGGASVELQWPVLEESR
ncbi:PAS domain S-box protein [Acetobacter sacchari]|uniref:histidine kinase n=1 Tax=Acetobacter sacchari TaxID=2661687 RepID=A0ABS3LQW5_9PROT|nr:PAS domain-containing sensor histidine kinase [Acetobacter sacchari]MBO1358281.1 PAS domain S-box protein [Acetobacter sacchari]